MRTRTYAATVLLMTVLALSGGTAAAQAADPTPVLDTLEDSLLPEVGVNLCQNSLGLPSVTVGDACAKNVSPQAP
jgi:hypothetical protein